MVDGFGGAEEVVFGGFNAKAEDLVSVFFEVLKGLVVVFDFASRHDDDVGDAAWYVWCLGLAEDEPRGVAIFAEGGGNEVFGEVFEFVCPTEAGVFEGALAAGAVDFVLVLVGKFFDMPSAGVVVAQGEVWGLVVLGDAVIEGAGVGEIFVVMFRVVWVGAVDAVGVFFVRDGNEVPEAGVVFPEDDSGVGMLF